MLQYRIFRERALVRSVEPEPLDDPAQVTAPHEWMLLVALAVILAGAVLWSVFGSVERKLSGDGALVISGKRFSVLSGVSGNVSEVFVNVGNTLEEESTIARVRVPEIEWRVRVARARLASLEEEAAASAGPVPVHQREGLAAARAELAEFTALDAEGGLVISPYSGVLTALHLERGQAITAGTPVAEIRTGGDAVLEAVTVLDPALVQRVRVGMPARVALATRDREGTHVVAARVAEVSSGPVTPARWLARLGIASIGDGGGRYLVRLALADEPDVPVPDGTPCRVEIVLGEYPPLGLLFAAGRPG